jgi:hypothetical protein
MVGSAPGRNPDSRVSDTFTLADIVIGILVHKPKDISHFNQSVLKRALRLQQHPLVNTLLQGTRVGDVHNGPYDNLISAMRRDGVLIGDHTQYAVIDDLAAQANLAFHLNRSYSETELKHLKEFAGQTWAAYSHQISLLSK